MMLYAKEHEGRLPECSKWCDAIYDGYGTTRTLLLCPETGGIPTGPGSAEPKVTDYGFNENLSGVKMCGVREPAMTVLLFEADRGTNVFGGRDRMIPEPRHPGGFNFLFVDGHSENVPKQNLDRLLWMPK